VVFLIACQVLLQSDDAALLLPAGVAMTGQDLVLIVKLAASVGFLFGLIGWWFGHLFHRLIRWMYS